MSACVSVCVHKGVRYQVPGCVFVCVRASVGCVGLFLSVSILRLCVCLGTYC